MELSCSLTFLNPFIKCYIVHVAGGIAGVTQVRAGCVPFRDDSHWFITQGNVHVKEKKNISRHSNSYQLTSNSSAKGFQIWNAIERFTKKFAHKLSLYKPIRSSLVKFQSYCFIFEATGRWFWRLSTFLHRDWTSLQSEINQSANLSTRIQVHECNYRFSTTAAERATCRHLRVHEPWIPPDSLREAHAPQGTALVVEEAGIAYTYPRSIVRYALPSRRRDLKPKVKNAGAVRHPAWMGKESKAGPTFLSRKVSCNSQINIVVWACCDTAPFKHSRASIERRHSVQVETFQHQKLCLCLRSFFLASESLRMRNSFTACVKGSMTAWFWVEPHTNSHAPYLNTSIIWDASDKAAAVNEYQNLEDLFRARKQQH